MKKNKNEISNIQEDGINISQNYLSFYKSNKSGEEDKSICELLDGIDFDKELNSTKAGLKKSSSSENEKNSNSSKENINTIKVNNKKYASDVKYIFI